VVARDLWGGPLWPFESEIIMDTVEVRKAKAVGLKTRAAEETRHFVFVAAYMYGGGPLLVTFFRGRGNHRGR